ncbi:MAG: response regulator [Syntrophales bacterium LBB04]|nr:response regulator [Syntrophales bacterium LBB04]
MRVLIVDDDQTIASIVQSILEDEGYEVRLALNALEGYLGYLQYLPDLVITDIQMPGKNGLELINHIREHDPMVKAIYMSGNLNQFYSLLKEERTKYPITFLEKPFSRKELVGQISQLVH